MDGPKTSLAGEPAESLEEREAREARARARRKSREDADRVRESQASLEVARDVSESKPSTPGITEDALFHILCARLEVVLEAIDVSQGDLSHRLERQEAIARANALEVRTSRQAAEARSIVRAPAPRAPWSVAPAPAPAARPNVVPLQELRSVDVGPFEIPDFGGMRRRSGQILVGMLIAGVIAAIVATFLSYA